MWLEGINRQLTAVLMCSRNSEISKVKNLKKILRITVKFYFYQSNDIFSS